MKKKILKILALVLALCLLGGVGFIANGLVGNPVSLQLAKKGAEEYLTANHADEGYTLLRAQYDFKIGGYYLKVGVPDSVDRHFVLYADFMGNITNSTYENDILRCGNTVERLNRSYREISDTIFGNASFSFEIDFAYGILVFEGDAPPSSPQTPDYALSQQDFAADVAYNVHELGEKAGRLLVYVRDGDVSVQRLSEILLEVKNAAVRAGVPFRTTDCVLQHLRPADGEAYNHEQVQVYDFPNSDIYEEGLLSRVQAAYDKTKDPTQKEPPVA